jgi:hypothetical protein
MQSSPKGDEKTLREKKTLETQGISSHGFNLLVVFLCFKQTGRGIFGSSSLLFCVQK